MENNCNKNSSKYYPCNKINVKQSKLNELLNQRNSSSCLSSNKNESDTNNYKINFFNDSISECNEFSLEESPQFNLHIIHDSENMIKFPENLIHSNKKYFDFVNFPENFQFIINI